MPPKFCSPGHKPSTSTKRLSQGCESARLNLRPRGRRPGVQRPGSAKRGSNNLDTSGWLVQVRQLQHCHWRATLPPAHCWHHWQLQRRPERHSRARVQDLFIMTYHTTRANTLKGHLKGRRASPRRKAGAQLAPRGLGQRVLEHGRASAATAAGASTSARARASASAGASTATGTGGRHRRRRAPLESTERSAHAEVTRCQLRSVYMI